MLTYEQGNNVFSAFALLSFLLSIIPFPWHLQAWNTGTCVYMFWTAVGTLNFFINSVVWRADAINRAPIWCDISTHLIPMVAVGIPAASLSINRRLYRIASVSSVHTTKREKLNGIFIDLAIGLGIPIIQLPFYYFTQGHRFDIYEQVGCYPAVHNTILAYLFIWIWPLVIGLISAVYCTLTIRSFLARRAQFKELLSHNHNLTSNRYFRLMGLAGIEILLTVPFSVALLYLNSQPYIVKYKSWADTHSNFGHVNQYPTILWSSSSLNVFMVNITRSLTVACGFIFFFFFGFAEEARKNYRSAYTSAAKLVGISTTGSAGGVTSSNGAKESKKGNMSSFGKVSLPSVFVRQETTRTTDRDSVTSSFDEKDDKEAFPRISLSSVFDETKVKEFVNTSSSKSSSSGSQSSRSSSPTPSHAPGLVTPPHHSADAPASVRGSHDMV